MEVITVGTRLVCEAEVDKAAGSSEEDPPMDCADEVPATEVPATEAPKVPPSQRCLAVEECKANPFDLSRVHG